MAEAWPQSIRPLLRDVTHIEPAPVGVPDDELMEGLIAGRITALEQLYDRYSALVFSVSLRVLADWQLAEDVTQEVFVRLWQRPHSYDPGTTRRAGGCCPG
jgi:hypothetical protein